MLKKLWAIILLAILPTVNACVPTMLTGRVSTATYVEVPQTASFVVVGSDNIALTERNIQALIVDRMKSRGFRQTEDSSTADIVVLYSYSIGAGQTAVTSSPDFVWGGQKVQSSTIYPRYFQITLVNQKAYLKGTIIWQGEIYSKGSSANISWLAESFIDEIFRHFGQTVTNKKFMKIIY